MSAKVLLLSVHPVYAEKLLNGTKRVELRRIKPNINVGDIVDLYFSSPVQEIRGTLKVEKVIGKPLTSLWANVRNDAGISKREFDDYYSGTDRGYGIYLNSPKHIRNPISLNELRTKWARFHPPQSYRYLSAAELNKVKAVGRNL
jgi:predicted transcriptional regulator